MAVLFEIQAPAGSRESSQSVGCSESVAPNINLSVGTFRFVSSEIDGDAEEDTLRFIIRFCLLAVMPFAALLETIWGIGVLPARGISAFAHVGPILAAEALWIACASLYLFMSRRNEDK